MGMYRNLEQVWHTSLLSVKKRFATPSNLICASPAIAWYRLSVPSNGAMALQQSGTVLKQELDEPFRGCVKTALPLSPLW